MITILRLSFDKSSIDPLNVITCFNNVLIVHDEFYHFDLGCGKYKHS
jgi:hypothetical protein